MGGGKGRCREKDMREGTDEGGDRRMRGGWDGIRKGRDGKSRPHGHF